MRGVVALAFLDRVEALLRARHGNNPHFRLSDYFDLIGGTSTGAIIAANLALGLTVAEVRRMYLETAPLAFRRVLWRLPGLLARFDARPLIRALQVQFGTRTLSSPDLRTGLAMITKRMDTGSPWVLSNNPRAPYWGHPSDASHIGNRDYNLASLVRASSAAPMLFVPERIKVAAGAPPGLFVDGGVSPHNNPSLQLLMMATMRGFGLNWTTGKDDLLLVSVGTGGFRHRMDPVSAGRATAAAQAVHALVSMMADSQNMVLTLMQWLSEASSPWHINSEIGDLGNEVLGGRALLSFQRYDMTLEVEWLRRELGEQMSHRDVAALRRLDNVATMPRLAALAARAAARQVAPTQFPAAFDLALPTP